MARDLRISRQKLTQQMLDEYLMFFQLITPDSYPVAILVFFGMRENWGLGILGDPGAVRRAGRKGATKVFKHRWKSPWVPTLTGPFPNGQANAGS